VTRPSAHHEEYVKMGLAYQQASYTIAHWNSISSLETIEISELELELFDLEKQVLILESPNLFILKN
jgi:hypothetical protein